MNKPRYYSGNPFLKLPFKFDVDKLYNDLKVAVSTGYKGHFNKDGYEGSWGAINLRSLQGSLDNILPGINSEDVYLDTEVLSNCTYLKEIVDSFLCEKQSVRILNLTAGSEILEHKDLNMGYEDGYMRIHVPVQTNEEVFFYIDNQRVEMKPGECWYGNFNSPHRVHNRSNEDRIHLVIDMVRNEWSDELFREVGYDFEKENTPPAMSKELTLQVIEQLKHHNTDSANEMIKQLKASL